jgi:hypothetical protein
MQNFMFFIRRHYKKSILLFIILTILPWVSEAAERSNMRGKRYCEIIIPKTISEYAVYNTLGLNDCPENIWDKITIEEVKKETDSSFVHLNGPRYWVIDGLKNSSLVSTTVKTIANLKMREAGVLHIRMLDLVRTKVAFKTRTVARKTTWLYDADKPVYELIDPQGTVFVMQSYSIQTTPQTLESLSQLGSMLKLPKGWQFKTGMLKKLEKLEAINEKAIVIQDDFLNTYQQATHDFLKE